MSLDQIHFVDVGCSDVQWVSLRKTPWGGSYTQED